MLKYLVILLSNKSTSFCHYATDVESEEITISTDDLKAAIMFGMKENLMIQFVYPDYELSSEHASLIESIDHINIKPIRIAKKTDVGVVNIWSDLSDVINCNNVVIRTSIEDLISNSSLLLDVLNQKVRVNISLTDIDSASFEQISKYRSWLIDFSKDDCKKISMELGQLPQLNILTDRLYLKTMHNCNAGVETITIAPDGMIYICPAFYHDRSESVGRSSDNIIFCNELLKLDRAPICRICDAWHCNRCVWSNRNSTHELNTPGKRQCLISHAEREASRLFLSALRERGPYMPDIDIKEIDYNEPFEKLQK